MFKNKKKKTREQRNQDMHDMYMARENSEKRFAEHKRKNLDTKFFEGATVITTETEWINGDVDDRYADGSTVWVYPKHQGNVCMKSGAEWTIGGFMVYKNETMVLVKLLNYPAYHGGTTYMNQNTVALMSPAQCKSLFGIKGTAPNPKDDTRIDASRTYKTPIDFYIKNSVLQIDKVKGARLISEQSMVKPMGIIKDNNVEFVMLELIAPFYNEENDVVDIGEMFSIPLNDMHALPFNSWETLDKEAKDTILAGVKERQDKKDEQRKLKIQEDANNATLALANSNNNVASSNNRPNYSSMTRTGGGSRFDGGGGGALMGAGIGGMIGLALGGGGGCD